MSTSDLALTALTAILILFYLRPYLNRKGLASVLETLAIVPILRGPATSALQCLGVHQGIVPMDDPGIVWTNECIDTPGRVDGSMESVERQRPNQSVPRRIACSAWTKGGGGASC